MESGMEWSSSGNLPSLSSGNLDIIKSLNTSWVSRFGCWNDWLAIGGQAPSGTVCRIAIKIRCWWISCVQSVTSSNKSDVLTANLGVVIFGLIIVWAWSSNANLYDCITFRSISAVDFIDYLGISVVDWACLSSAFALSVN